MKKTTAYLFAFIACTGLLWTCNKEEKPPTIIKGKVTDKVTGLPVNEAEIAFKYSPPKSTKSCTVDYSTITDFQGLYTRSIKDSYDWCFQEVYKPGYLPNIEPAFGKSIELNVENTLDITLVPEDAFLKIILINDMPGNDSIYVSYFNKTIAEHFSLNGIAGDGAFQIENCFPKFILGGNIYEKILTLPSSEYIKLYWDTKQYPLKGPFSFQDSVYMLRYDTVTYSIHF